MEEQKQIVTWNDLVSSNFVRLETDKRKVLVLKDWKLEKVKRFEKELVKFSAEVVEEDGVVLQEKKRFETTSNRLKLKLRLLFENEKLENHVKLAITRFGEKFSTYYGVEKL